MIVDQPSTPAPPPAGDQRSFAERWRPLLIASASTVVVFGLLIWGVSQSDNWPRIQRQFFSWEAMKESAPDVWTGFQRSLLYWVIILVASMVAGLVLAMIRAIPGPAAAPFRLMVIIYTDLMRGIPIVLLIVLVGFGVPSLRISGLPNEAEFWGAVAMIASYSAYIAEVFRSGIDAVHTSQRAAATALGLSHLQTLRYAIVPQAVRNVIPALLNLVIAMQKDVALLSVVGAREAVREAQIYQTSTFNYSSLTVAAIFFIMASVPMARFTDWYTERDRSRRLQRAG